MIFEEFLAYILFFVTSILFISSIVCDCYLHDKLRKRVEQIEADVKSLKNVSGFLFCSFMDHINNSDISKGDKNDTNIS